MDPATESKWEQELNASGLKFLFGKTHLSPSAVQWAEEEQVPSWEAEVGWWNTLLHPLAKAKISIKTSQCENKNFQATLLVQVNP